MKAWSVGIHLMTDDDFPYNYQDDPVDDITTYCDNWSQWLSKVEHNTRNTPAITDYTHSRLHIAQD